MAAHLEALAESLLDELALRNPVGYRPRLEWRNLRVTAGLAFYKEGLIVLSRLVVTDAERLRVTLLHEYAHLLAFARQGMRGAGHGPAWQAAMRELGLPPNVRHAYDVRRNERRQAVTYRCLRCGSALERHRRLPRRRKWMHAGCGGALKLESVKSITARSNQP